MSQHKAIEFECPSCLAAVGRMCAGGEIHAVRRTLAQNATRLENLAIRQARAARHD